MKRVLILIASLALLVFPHEGRAQVASSVVLSSCGGASYTAGKQAPQTMDTTGKGCMAATLSGSVNVQAQGTAATGAAASGNPVQIGGVTGGGLMEPLSVDATGHLNVQGATVNGSAIGSQGGMIAAGTDGANVRLLSVDTSGNLNVNATLKTSAVKIGSVAIDQTTPGTTNGVQTLSGSVVNSTLQAGSAIVGKVGIDQTTPGTTNGVQTLSGSVETSTGNVASGATDSGNPVKVGGVFNTSLTTLTTGQRGDAQLDSKGRLFVTIGQGSGTANAVIASPGDGATAQSGLATFSQLEVFNGTNLDRARDIAGAVAAGSVGTGTLAMETGGAPFSHISTNTTTTVKSGAGILHKICINTKGVAANTATIYDNTAGSGTIIGVLDTTANAACNIYDAAFATGLTIVTATGTAPDMTVTYR